MCSGSNRQPSCANFWYGAAVSTRLACMCEPFCVHTSRVLMWVSHHDQHRLDGMGHGGKTGMEHSGGRVYLPCPIPSSLCWLCLTPSLHRVDRNGCSDVFIVLRFAGTVQPSTRGLGVPTAQTATAARPRSGGSEGRGHAVPPQPCRPILRPLRAWGKT